MEILVFFYNIIIMSAFIFCAVDFCMLYRKHRDKRLLYIGIVFILFIVDNMLLYMNEFLPEFAIYYSAALNNQPYIANIMVAVICFSYRLVFMSYEQRAISTVEIIVWFMMGFCLLLSSLAYSYPVGKAASVGVACSMAIGATGAPLLYIRRNGPYQSPPTVPKMHTWFVVSLFVLEIGNVVERILSEFEIRLMVDRILFVELISLLFVASAGAYIIREFVDEPHAEDALPDPVDENEIQVLESFCENYALTPREHDIVSYLILGYSNEQICQEACIAQGTVKSHTHNIYQKMGITSRIQLMAKLNDYSRSKRI